MQTLSVEACEAYHRRKLDALGMYHDGLCIAPGLEHTFQQIDVFNKHLTGRVVAVELKTEHFPAHFRRRKRLEILAVGAVVKSNITDRFF